MKKSKIALFREDVLSFSGFGAGWVAGVLIIAAGRGVGGDLSNWHLLWWIPLMLIVVLAGEWFTGRMQRDKITQAYNMGHNDAVDLIFKSFDRYQGRMGR